MQEQGQRNANTIRERELCYCVIMVHYLHRVLESLPNRWVYRDTHKTQQETLALTSHCVNLHFAALALVLSNCVMKQALQRTLQRQSYLLCGSGHSHQRGDHTLISRSQLLRIRWIYTIIKFRYKVSLFFFVSVCLFALLCRASALSL